MAPATQLSLFEADPAQQWRIRSSARARRLMARVTHDGTVEIVVPAGVRARQITAFLTRHRQWIERQQRRAVPAQPFPPQQIELLALGERWLCQRRPLTRPLQQAEATSAEYSGLLLLGSEAGEQAVRAGLRQWLSARAREAWLPALQALAIEMNCRVQQMQLRWQRTRWGSCSTRGTISLNGCLLFQRPEVVRYLWVHELAHLHHMNHGPRFWGRVAQFEASWQLLDRELRDGWQRVPHWILVE